MQISRTALWISGGTLLISLLGILPTYLVFFDKPDLVYEMRFENIPLPKNLPGQLPDSLAIITIQNLGRRPSVDLQSSLTVNGDLIDYQVQGPNAAYGEVSHLRNGPQIMVNCRRLASGDYPIKILAWYKSATSVPDAGVSDSRGAGRRVSSITAEKTKYKQWGSLFLGLLAGSVGSLVAIGAMFRLYKLRKSISEAARKLEETTDAVGTVANQDPGEMGTVANQEPE